MSKGRRHTPPQTNVAAEVVVTNAEEVTSNGLAAAIGLGGGQQGFSFPGTPGTERVEQAGTIFKNLRYYLVTNFRQMLSQAYVELGLVQAIVDIPVDDAFRGGVEIKSQQLDEDQVAELLISIDRDNDLAVCAQAAKWQRLFGGGGVIVLSDQDPEEPLDLDAIGPDSTLEFRAVDMWELYGNLQITEGHEVQLPNGQSFGQEEFYNYYSHQIHHTRVMRLMGKEAPSFIRPRLRGWGVSVVETLVRSINQYLKATDLGFEVLDEFKLDVFKIKGLVNTLAYPGGTQKIQERIQLANWQKNYQNAMVMDAEDDFDHKQLSFAGLADAMAGIRMQIASDMRMPLTKIFGISAAGFNSGEDDIEVYNSMVEGTVRSRIKYDVLRVAELKCQKLFGFVPDDLSVEFKPLRVLSAEQEENVKTQKFTRLIQAKQAGEITTLEFRDSCNKGNLFDIKLDTTDEDVNPDDPEIEDVLAGKEADDAEAEALAAAGGGEGGAAPKGKKSATGAKDAKQVKNTWDESKHPRAADGKFGEGGGSTQVHHSTYEGFASKDIQPSKGGYYGEGFYVHKDKSATYQYGSNTHTYELSQAERVMDLSGEAFKPDALKFFEEIGLDVEKINKPSRLPPMAKVISEIRSKYPGEETIGSGAMTKLREFLKEQGYIGIQFSHNDTDENMVIFDRKDLGLDEEKKANALTVMPRKWNRAERAVRLINSPEFDRHSYDLDGGDGWIDVRRSEFFESPDNVDQQLWAKARAASQAAFDGVVKWQFCVWWYKKQGGRFT